VRMSKQRELGSDHNKHGVRGFDVSLNLPCCHSAASNSFKFLEDHSYLSSTGDTRNVVDDIAIVLAMRD
jgi:hypothetical protein